MAHFLFHQGTSGRLGLPVVFGIALKLPPIIILDRYSKAEEGPENSSTSCRTPSPLLALAYGKMVKLPIGFRTLQLMGALRGEAGFGWLPTPGRGLPNQ